jgi:hypothetical protein
MTLSRRKVIGSEEEERERKTPSIVATTLPALPKHFARTNGFNCLVIEHEQLV